MFQVTIMSTIKVLYRGNADSAIFPGDLGVFEVQSFHKRMISRLLKGSIEIDGDIYPIERGIVKIEKNTVTAVVEE